MNNLRRFIFVTAAVIAAFIQGCGCSDSKKKHYPPPQEQNTYTVTGTAGKGILSGFMVEAYKFNISGVLDPLPISTAITSAIGRYSLNIPNLYINQPLLIQLTPGPTSPIMTCDLSNGCATGINFGQPYPITDSSFVLETLVPSTSNNSVANITLLTTLAAQLAQEAISSGSTVAQIQTAINQANSRVANRFGLMGDLPTMPVIDLTDSAAVSAALNAGNASHVQYAALNAAIVQAALADNNLLGFIGALNAFITYFVDGGIAGNTSNAAETSLADILREAGNILTLVQSRDPNAPQSLTALLQRLLTEMQLALAEQPDQRSTGTPSTGAGATDLEKAKNMVADLRDFAASIGESSLEGGLSVGSVSDAFTMQLEAAEMTGSAHTRYILDALAIAGAAIDDANRAYGNNNALQSYTGAQGVVVAISLVEDKPVFTVARNIMVQAGNGTVTVAVDLMAHNHMDIENTDTDTGEIIEAEGRFDISGTASTSQLMLTIDEDSNLAVVGLEHNSANQQNHHSSTQAIESVDLVLGVSLAEVLPTGSDPVTVTGTLRVSLQDLSAENTETPNSGATELGVGTVSLNFSGVASNTTGESFAFALSMAGDATGVSFVDSWGPAGANSGETVESFVEFSASLGFTAALTGIPSAVSVAYDLERTGLEDGTNSLVVRYPGKLFRFSMDVEDGEPVNPMTIVNQDRAIMTLNENTVAGESVLTGVITVNGVVHANIEERSNGVIVITFSDDSVVSL